MQQQVAERDAVTLHQNPNKADHVLAFNLLRNAGYHVECVMRRTEIILVVNDPVYYVVRGELIFSHNEIVHLNSSIASTLLMAAVHFINERS